MNRSIIRTAAAAFTAAVMLFCTACDTIDDAAAAAAERLPGLIEAGEEALGRLQEKGQELPEKIKEAAPDLIAQIEEATGLDFEAIAEKAGSFLLWLRISLQIPRDTANYTACFLTMILLHGKESGRI